MDHSLQPQQQTTATSASDFEASRLAGVPVSLARVADAAGREGNSCFQPNMEVTVVDSAVLKRKRGRPAKGAPKVAPPVRQTTDEEDVCFICFDGGSLVLCDRRGCPKAYHPSCIKRDEAFFRSKAKWNCGWHICCVCQKGSHYMCYTCTYSLCKGCTKDADFVCVRENKGLCGICLRTIMMIENSGHGNKEMCEVDFDDKSSWEYLFKVYWMYLKGKLSLTLEEIFRAKNPWKGAAPMSCKIQSPYELHHLRNDKGFGSENSCTDIISNNLKNKRPKRQPKLHGKGNCLDRITSGGDSGVSLPECTKWASMELLKFVAHMKNGDTSPLSQFDVQTLLLEYANKNNLHDPQHKSQIVCDSRLLSLFGKARVDHIEMLKLLESHFLLKDNVPAENTFGAGAINAVVSEGEAIENYNRQLVLVDDKRCKTHNQDAYAAIDVHNINLIYLRRSLIENLTEDVEKIHEKVVGSFVRIRISSSDQKQDMYRLVQVVGTSKAAEPYNIGKRTTDIKLEILNLNRKEVISIAEISNQEFSEDECKRLRQSIKYGLSKRLSVGEILDKALTLQAIRVNDLLEAEILRLNNLRDRASEKGHRKELKEYVEKLQLLNSQEERQRRLHEIPDVHSDPNLDSMFESDEDDGESDERKQDSNIISKYLGFDRRERGFIFPRISNGVSNDMAGKTQDLPATQEVVGNVGTGKYNIQWDDSANAVVKSEVSSGAVEISSPVLSTGMQQSFNDFLNDRSWYYQDPTGKIQGPFSMLHLYKWNASGSFPPDLRIWRTGEKQDNSILLTDALSGKCSKNVSLPFNSQLLSLGVSVSLDNKDNNQDAGKNSMNEIYADGQIIEQSKEQKVDNTSTQSDGKDELVRSNRWHGQLHVYPLQLSTGIPEKLNENPSDIVRKGHMIVGNLTDNGNNGSNRISNKRSYQKPSDSEENSGQSSGQIWRHPNVNSSSNCLDTISAHASGTKTSQHKLGFDLQNPPSPPACNTSSGQTWNHPNGNSSSNCLVNTSAQVSGRKTSPQKLGFDLHNPPSPPVCNTGEAWRHPDINGSSNCLVSTSTQISGTKTSPQKLGFDLHNPPSPPACNTSTWQAIIGEPNDFDESVSDLLAEVEAMESLGGLESATSIMNCGEDLTEGSKNDCLSFVAELGPMLDAGKGDALSSTSDLNLPSQSTAAEEPLRQADVHHHHHQRISAEHSSRSSKVEVGTKNVSVSSNQWDSGSENSPVVPSPGTLGLAVDTTWRLGLENTHLGWSGVDQGNANVHWVVGQTEVQENRSSSSYTSVTSGFGDSQTRYGSERFSVPRDRGFQGHGRSRIAYSRQQSYGVGNGGSDRPLPKGQRVCKFYESGHCKKGASCDYWHP